MKKRKKKSKQPQCTKLTINQWLHVFVYVEKIKAANDFTSNGTLWKPAVRQYLTETNPEAALGLTSGQWGNFADQCKRRYKDAYEYKIIRLLGYGDLVKKISCEQPKRLLISKELQNLMAAKCWRIILIGEKLTEPKVFRI